MIVFHFFYAIVCQFNIQCYDLKGQGHVTVNKPVIYRIYIVAHRWPFRSVQILVDGVNPHYSYFLNSANISAIAHRMFLLFVSLRSTRVHLQNNTFILRKVVESHSDMDYQIYCNVVVSKKISLRYVTLPL